MMMTLKQKIFEDTLKNPYSLKDFVNFSRELLTGLKIFSPRPQKPTQNFSEHIKEFYPLGKQNNIAVLTVNLQKNKSVERARSVQRNFVKTLLENENSVDGAIVAFYSDSAPEKWRLSFVRLDYNFAVGGAKIKITPAKRYSYLVGENEPCETARQQLFPIFENDSATVTLDDLENAFSVERVTKEFFDKYAEKFYQVKDFLESNSDFKIESQAHGFTAEQFTKKLLGQIVFLYFLQKKGWLGVEKNSAWGTGSQNFMRDIFKKSIEAGENFFDDCLEPLFYTALNVDRTRKNDLYPKLNLRIPFLNGGLFEELDNYDWQKNNFQIPNEIFSNENTEGRDADGILDIFDRYNFTINEDEPTEREVAIDPEMLGKVFENLLDTNDRKSKGAFYTPREIVHYMCRETLISYLVEKSKISEDAIRNFILYGEYFKDADISNFAENNSLQISEEIFCPEKKINRLAEIDKFLQDVKVADLAVGSGAFPLGMLNEITKAREVLISYLNLGKSEKILPNLYDLKISTIKNSIFACDIEPSAVDIAKLRLWLSIVIEDGPTADKNNFTPKPLPNLDCNIICGNSLIDEFEGVPLIKHSEVLNNTDDGEYQTSIFQGKVDVRISDLIRIQKNLFHESDHARKEEFRKYIRDIYDDIITEQLGKKTALAKKYKLAASQKSLPFILWQLYFPTVFKNNGGFDIIIGNPPYIDSESMTKTMPELREIYSRKFQSAKGNWDLYILFWERGFNLLNNSGIISLITANKWLSIKYGETLRKMFLNHICNISDYSSFYAFQSADVSTTVAMVKRGVAEDVKIVKFNQGYEKISEHQANKSFLNDFNNFGLLLSNNFKTLSKLLANKKLGDYFNITGAATVSETYEIAKFVSENGTDSLDKNLFFKFINTGTIDKFTSLWGIKQMTYVKNKYMFPVIDKIHLKNKFPKRFQQALSPKLITTGIRYFEVFGDFDGEYLAAKSTEIITSKANYTIEEILPVLNSSVVFFFLKEAYGGMAMDGGITFSPDNLSKIPIPCIGTTDKKKLEHLSEIYFNSFDSEKLDTLDKYVYKLYGLNDDDVENIEKFKRTVHN